MNERIGKLAEKAGLLGPSSRIGNSHEAAERFAQLIIRECIKQLEPSTHHQAYPNSYLGGEEGLELLEEQVYFIKKHFGIE